MKDPFMESVKRMRQERRKMYRGLYNSLLPGRDTSSGWKQPIKKTQSRRHIVLMNTVRTVSIGRKEPRDGRDQRTKRTLELQHGLRLGERGVTR